MLRIFTPVLIGILLVSCHKHSGVPTLFTVRGQVVDTVSHRILSNIKVYLVGGNMSSSDTIFGLPGLDSAATDAHGNFVLPHTTETVYNAYAVTVKVPTPFNGFQTQPGCYLDAHDNFYNLIEPGSGAQVTVYARATGLIKLNLQVDSNPYDTLVVVATAPDAPGAKWTDTLIGRTVNATILIPSLPLSGNTIQVGIYTAALRDSIPGLFTTHREEEYSITPGALDTPVLNLRYASAYEIQL